MGEEVDAGQIAKQIAELRRDYLLVPLTLGLSTDESGNPIPVRHTPQRLADLIRHVESELAAIYAEAGTSNSAT